MSLKKRPLKHIFIIRDEKKTLTLQLEVTILTATISKEKMTYCQAFEKFQ
jgi:hypothetical protein